MATYPDLDGKVALITGASSGIGRAAAIALANQGMAITVNYFANEQGALDTVAAVENAGGRAIAVRADVRVKDEILGLVDQSVRKWGPVDVLVNNAGSLVERLRILELTEAVWDDVLSLNLKSAFLCSQAVAKSMMDRKSGTIINVSSIAGRNGGGPGAIPYATAKGGMVTFTKALAKEMATHGVRVNGVNPGVIDTRFHERFSTPESMEAFRRMTPLGRNGSPEEIGDAIAFLASQSASFLTGETIEVNGGLWMD